MRTTSVAGLELSVVGLGTNNFGRNVDVDATARVVHAAIDAGVTFIDTADKYGSTLSEEYLGRALVGRRDQVVLATKFGLPVDDDPLHRGASRRWITQAVEHSLRRLRTDVIDLYQVHAPDVETPIEETLETLGDLRRAGKIRAAGCSNFDAAQLAEAADAAQADGRREPLALLQNEYSLLEREVERNGVLDACTRLGVGFTPYYPLASGLLTGKYRAGEPPPPDTRFAVVDRYQPMWTERNLRLAGRLADLAAAHGRAPVDLAVSWLLTRPAVVSVICGATRAEQVAVNAAAAAWDIPADVLKNVDELTAANRDTADHG